MRTCNEIGIETDRDHTHINYYDEWQKEVTARKQLENVFVSLHPLNIIILYG